MDSQLPHLVNAQGISVFPELLDPDALLRKEEPLTQGKASVHSLGQTAEEAGHTHSCQAWLTLPIPIPPKLGQRSFLDFPCNPEPFLYHHKIASIVCSQGLHIGFKGKLRRKVLHLRNFLLVENAPSRKAGKV